MKERYIEVVKEGNRRIKRCIHRSRKEKNGEFRRKTNQEESGGRKLILNEVGRVQS